MTNVNAGTTDIVLPDRVVAPGEVFPDDLTDEQVAFFTQIGSLAPAAAVVKPQVVDRLPDTAVPAPNLGTTRKGKE